MQNEYNYKKKNVHDISIGNSFVRLWHSDGSFNKKIIINSFQRLLKTSFVDPYIALMPDYHQSGETMIGSVIPTKNILLPSIIGNDIGCGMLAVKLPFTIKALNNLHDILYELKLVIPTGTDQNNLLTERVKRNPLWKKRDNIISVREKEWGKLFRQFATLGSGNHFFEILEDTEGMLWIIVHSGSRYIGALINKYYITAGSEEAGIDQNIYRKTPYLYSDSQLSSNYLNDYDFAVNYAKESRMEMILRAFDVFAKVLSVNDKSRLNKALASYIDVAHNSLSLESHFGESLFIHRKGAINLPQGKYGIIPGSMGTSSFIVEGRNGKFSFNSCSHGAGRIMSRGEAIRNISTKDFNNSMSGVVYDESKKLKDEAPQAYKDIRQVLRSQKDIVKIHYELNPLISLKG